jgi:hypothetical protein
LVIPSFFILGYIQLSGIIVGYFLLLKVISPYVIIDYTRLYYHTLFVVIGLVAIVGNFIGGYLWLFYYKLLLNILGYIIIG